MKCRILKKGNKFYAQYYDRPGKNVKLAYAWCNLKKTIFDQRDGNYEIDYFDTEKEAERALIQYAESHSKGIVVKEFEA